MRRLLWLAAAAVVCLPSAGFAQQQSQPAQDSQSASQNQPPAQAPAQTNSSAAPAPQQESLADAARKAREQKRETPKAAKVFDNDSIPTTGGINTVGSAAAPADGSAQGGQPPDANGANDEKTWKQRFADLRHKLDQDKQELALLQREMGVANVNYYSDPVKGMQQGLTQDDIHKKQAAIDAKQKQVAADQQAINDAEDALRKAGGDPGWAR
jgi:hypothetical protein